MEKVCLEFNQTIGELKDLHKRQIDENKVETENNLLEIVQSFEEEKLLQLSNVNNVKTQAEKRLLNFKSELDKELKYQKVGDVYCWCTIINILCVFIRS